MRARHSPQAAFSLFSFQDIITSVMGVVILVLLVMTLELVSRQLDVPAVQHAVTQKHSTLAIEAARQRIAELHELLGGDTGNDMAGMTASELRSEQASLDRLIPQLEEDLVVATARVRQLDAQREQADSRFAERNADRLELKQLLATQAQLTAQLENLRSSKTLLFRAGRTAGRQPWLIQLSGRAVTTAPLGPRSVPISIVGTTTDSRQRQLLAWAEGQDPARVYFVLMVQPGGAPSAVIVEKSLREMGFAVGLDLLGEDQSAIDPQDGAPTVAAKGDVTP